MTFLGEEVGKERETSFQGGEETGSCHLREENLISLTDQISGKACIIDHAPDHQVRSAQETGELIEPASRGKSEERPATETPPVKEEGQCKSSTKNVKPGVFLTSGPPGFRLQSNCSNSLLPLVTGACLIAHQYLGGQNPLPWRSQWSRMVNQERQVSTNSVRKPTPQKMERWVLT